MSHDWPNTIEQHGDTQALIRRKPFFKDEVCMHSNGLFSQR
jgi:lariat debranching enzyme